MRDDDEDGSDIAEGLDRASPQNETMLARRLLHRRRRPWLPRAIFAFGAAGIWVGANLNRDPSAGALFVQREENTAADARAQATVAPSNQIAATIAAFETTLPNVAANPATIQAPPVSVPMPTLSLRLTREEPNTVSAAQEPAVVPSPTAAVPSEPPRIRAPTSAQVDTYLKRARELVGLGDVFAARLMLSRAAEGKDSRALVALAETYDPVVLRRWRVVGMRPDPDRARALYEEAVGQGSKTAGEHLLAMN
jgi:hypothetical protein